MELFVQILISLCVSLIVTFSCVRVLQILQQSSYRFKDVYKWIKNQKGDFFGRYFSLAFFSFLPMMMFWICFRRYEYYIADLGILIFFAIGILFIVTSFKQFKVPLKFTHRIIRMMLVIFVLSNVINFPLIYFAEYFWIFGYSLIGVATFFAPLIVFISYLITLPVERAINRFYLKRASRKLRSMSGLIKIGITGSYGKTTAKNILGAMLSSNFRVCTTPSSYNTLMGLCRTVNEKLSLDDEVFIAEMGARHIGDIKELCEFIKPQYGMITAIGDMHLQTFGSRDNIEKTKFELIESLEPDGVAVFNGDDESGEKLFRKTNCKKLLSRSNLSPLFADYDNVEYGTYGTRFRLTIDGESVLIQTKLLGAHIPSLITQCAMLSIKLGVKLQDIVEACKKLEQIPHRLQLIDNGNIIIIDDSFNSNPKGAENAVEILGQFSGTKILVTPGIVELGELQSDINRSFGAVAAKNADIIIAIAKNAPDIINGALDAGMSKEKIIKCDTLNDATQFIKNLPFGMYVILYENDLPDIY